MGCGLSKRPLPILTEGERRLRATLLIQRWYRRQVARIVAKRNCNWAIFEEIEYVGEQNQQKLHRFFASCLEILPKYAQFLPSSLNGLDAFSDDPNDIKVEDAYDGIHLDFPLTLKSLKIVLESFRAKQVLHAKYVLKLIQEAKGVLRKQPNINRVSTQVTGEITVIGDIHGRLHDLLIIFSKNGLPSSTNPYIFNGDFVDRGRNSTEVVLILFMLLLLYPNAVYLNRGNHEDYLLNIRYGFTKELTVKYGTSSGILIRAFRDVFRFLPLACLVDKRVLVVHGGISREITIDSIEKLERHKYVSVLRPEHADNAGQWKQILDLLWSDPHSDSGCSPNDLRGGGSFFGADVSKRLLEENGFDLLVRSHQCKQEGFEYTHNSKVLTVFSASNYYGLNTNLGAYVKLFRRGRPHCVQFQAKRMTKGLTIREQVSAVEESALRELKEKLLASKEKLLEEYAKFDEDTTGLISIENWVSVSETVTRLSVPWRMLRRRLVQMRSGKIDYSSGFLLDNENVAHKLSLGVTETLYRNRENLETIFHIIDKDNSGFLSVDEFKAACELLGQHAGIFFPDDFAEDLLKSMDFDKDGAINLNEFLESFRIVDSS
ncbi:serine/threonine-protein phosphatase with EF-hands 2-like [Oscarella lobularis]|uniref:serine/threonine-protein phosphatase with EF-hands 2-like n=1 Tax=Oscarella lobularis TaxID=121494 RepID=UPI003313DD86